MNCRCLPRRAECICGDFVSAGCTFYAAGHFRTSNVLPSVQTRNPLQTAICNGYPSRCFKRSVSQVRRVYIAAGRRLNAIVCKKSCQRRVFCIPKYAKKVVSGKLSVCQSMQKSCQWQVFWILSNIAKGYSWKFLPYVFCDYLGSYRYACGKNPHISAGRVWRTFEKYSETEMRYIYERKV